MAERDTPGSVGGTVAPANRLLRAQALATVIAGPVIDLVGVIVVGWLVYTGRLTVLGGMPWLALIYANKRPPGTVAGSAVLGLLWLGRRGA